MWHKYLIGLLGPKWVTLSASSVPTCQLSAIPSISFFCSCCSAQFLLCRSHFYHRVIACIRPYYLKCFVPFQMINLSQHENSAQVSLPHGRRGQDELLGIFTVLFLTLDYFFFSFYNDVFNLQTPLAIRCHNGMSQALIFCTVCP